MQKLLSFFTVMLSVVLILGACQSASEDSDSESQEMNSAEEQPMQSPQMSGESGADIELTDEDLIQLNEINVELQEVQNTASDKFMATIEGKGMTSEEYQQLSQQLESGAGDQISESQVNTMEEINSEMMNLREEMQEEMETVLEEHGYTMERFQEMSTIISQNPEYQQRFMELQSN